MPIYTPRGIKIRIAVSYAFGLMTRLYPEVSPFRILKTTEGIESLPAMFAIISGIIGFLMQLPPLQIGLAAGIAQLLGVLINTDSITCQAWWRWVHFSVTFRGMASS